MVPVAVWADRAVGEGDAWEALWRPVPAVNAFVRPAVTVSPMNGAFRARR